MTGLCDLLLSAKRSSFTIAKVRMRMNCFRYALRGKNASLSPALKCHSCRRKRRGELTRSLSQITKKRSAFAPLIFWWTCAELNCGLTRFLRGYYTLSRRSVSPEESSPTTFPGACFRRSPCGRGSQPPQRVPHLIDASF